MAATDISATDYKSFTIDKNTGKIKVNGELNYEKKSHYSVRVVATDGDDPTLSTYVDAIIKINDVNDQPTFGENEYTFKVYEDAGVGSVVDTVAVDDEDVWAEHTYEFSDYEDGSKDAVFFKVDSEGIIRLSKEKLEKKLYQVVLKAEDNGKSRGFQNYIASTLVNIDVIDPMFAGVAELYEVDEDAVIGTTLDTNIDVTVDYRDKDKDKVQKPEPRIEGTNDAGTAKAEDMFEVNLTENGDQWTFTISVKDDLNYIELYNPDTKDAVFNVTLAVKDPLGLTGAAKTKIRVNGKKPEITFGEGQTWRTYYVADESRLVPDGVKAYVVSGLNATGTAVVLQQVSYLKKGVALLLGKSEGATSEPNPDDEFKPNLLKYADTDVDAADGMYVLYMNEFLKATGKIPQGNRYLDLSGAGAAARSLILDGTTTSIDERPLGVEPGEAVWYTIGGQRVDKPTKPGIYIKRSAGRGEKLRK